MFNRSAGVRDSDASSVASASSVTSVSSAVSVYMDSTAVEGWEELTEQCSVEDLAAYAKVLKEDSALNGLTIFYKIEIIDQNGLSEDDVETIYHVRFFESLDNEDGQSTNAKKPLHLIAEYKSKEGFGNAFDGCREKLKKRYRNHTKRLDKVFQLVQAHT